MKSTDCREISLSYYGLVDLRIYCINERDAELFNSILREYLMPFLQVKAPTGQPHYTILLRQGDFDLVGSDWTPMTFFVGRCRLGLSFRRGKTLLADKAGHLQSSKRNAI